MTDWLYEGAPVVPEDFKDYYGFIYLITNLQNNRKYIGRKYFTKAGRRQVKGKVKKVRLESDWQDYYGSSEELKADVIRYGKENFRREILILCKSRGETNYWELKTILERDALLKVEYYNAWCSGKIHARHIRSLWIEDERFPPELLLREDNSDERELP